MQGKLREVILEHHFLSRNRYLNDLPESLSTEIIESLLRLEGTSPFEALSILNALHSAKRVNGDICEFGIAQGSTSRLIASFIMEQQTEKKLVLIDSFQGLSTPTAEDKLKDDIFDLGSMKNYAGSMAFDSGIALSKLRSIAFPQKFLQIIPGFIQDSIKSGQFPELVSFGYVDFDLYEPIKIALDYLYDATQVGAKIIVDDYDFFSTGAKTAVDEFLARHPSSFSIQIPEKALGHFCVLTRI